MGKDIDVSKPTGSSPSPRRGDSRDVVKVIKNVLVGVGALYLATGSVVVTIIGSVVAAVLVTLYVLTRKP